MSVYILNRPNNKSYNSLIEINVQKVSYMNNVIVASDIVDIVSVAFIVWRDLWVVGRCRGAVEPARHLRSRATIMALVMSEIYVDELK